MICQLHQFCKSNFPQDMEKSINHKDAECPCLEALESCKDTRKGALGICYPENSKHSMKNVFCGVRTMMPKTVNQKSKYSDLSPEGKWKMIILKAFAANLQNI